MDERSASRSPSWGISDVALEFVMGHLDDAGDRDAVSRVCKKWHRIDALTRKRITIALCYSTTPERLLERFPWLESLKLKGKPRAAMFNLIPDDWGGYAGPWTRVLAQGFPCLRSIYFRRMIVRDADLELLSSSRAHTLQALFLDKCSGFSTDSLKLLGRTCSRLKTLFLEESSIKEKDGEWVRALALNNAVLESLNFYMTELRVSPEDLALLATKCRRLRCLKISDCDVLELGPIFAAAAALEEFGGGSFNDSSGEEAAYRRVRFPPGVCRLSLSFMGTQEMPAIFPLAANLKKLDLQFTFLSTEDHCQLIHHCCALEVLEVRNVIGDRGLETVGERCKRLRRLRIERGEDEYEDEQGKVSHRGLIAVARGCLELEYLAVYVSDITNAALEELGALSKKLRDFRLVLLDREERITELPLDRGVRALLAGCTSLRRFALYLRQGGLTDAGLQYIGELSQRIGYMLLGYVGETDEGLLAFARGCPVLQKLELRGCCFSERAIARAVLQLQALRYVWVQGYRASPRGADLLAMARPFWNIEFIPPQRFRITADGPTLEQPAQILAYFSLAGARPDCPAPVVSIYPPPPSVSLYLPSLPR
ncbi:coronatine-insensitive protein homolog 2-like [Wolffia australiana]